MYWSLYDLHLISLNRHGRRQVSNHGWWVGCSFFWRKACFKHTWIVSSCKQEPNTNVWTPSHNVSGKNMRSSAKQATRHLTTSNLQGDCVHCFRHMFPLFKFLLRCSFFLFCLPGFVVSFCCLFAKYKIVSIYRPLFDSMARLLFLFWATTAIINMLWCLGARVRNNTRCDLPKRCLISIHLWY